MQALIRESICFFKSFHTITKRIFKYGFPIVLLLWMMALFFWMTAPYTAEIYQWERLKQEFFLCGKDIFTILLLYGLTFECIQKAIALETHK